MMHSINAAPKAKTADPAEFIPHNSVEKLDKEDFIVKYTPSAIVQK
jgi:hypothetical protein